MDQKQITLSESEIKGLVKDAVTETLTGLGFDIKNLLAVQRDLQYLRDWRHTTESIRGKAVIVAVGLTVAGLCSVLWLGFKALVNIR